MFRVLKKNKKFIINLLLPLFLTITPTIQATPSKQTIKALYIPLADHYAALVAYERYSKHMVYADFQIQQMKNWDLLRAYFQSGEVDMAYVMSPLAMDMYNEKPHFRWIGLMHRDGNALAINEILKSKINLPKLRAQRKPDNQVSQALRSIYEETGKPIQIGMPHLLATHTVVLYKYLKEHGLNLTLDSKDTAVVQAFSLAPPKAPAYIKSKSIRAEAAAFEQSLPWADIVETGGYGHVAWYSKDVMPWKQGHVECIALATDFAIKNKFMATKEVMNFIKKAGDDIENARLNGGEQLEDIVKIIRKHIPAHTRESIIASLDPDLRVINYQNLNVDKLGLKQIMDLAVEGNILNKKINIDNFSDTRFDIEYNN